MNIKDKEELYQKLQDYESDWVKMRDIAEKMQAENKKLREALFKIANDRSPPWDKMDYQDIAREALKEVGNK